MFHPRALFRTLVPLLALVLLLGGCIMPPRDEDPTPVPTEPTVVDEATPEPETQTVTVTANANVRSGPDTGYAVSFWLTEGTVVTVTDHNTAGDWLQIEHGVQAGWIFAALTDAAMDVQGSKTEDLEPEPMKDRVITTVPEPTVEPTAEPTEEAMPESTTETPSTVTVTGTVVNLRTGPGTDHPTDGQVHAGDQLQVTGRNQDGSWLQIMHPTTTGEHIWIYGSLTGMDGATVQTLAVVAMVEATLEPPPVGADADAGTPLCTLASAGQDGIVRLRNAAVLAPSLHESSAAGDTKTVARLLAEGADPNGVDRDGDTALHHAARRGQAGAVSLLLEYGATPNVVNADRSTPLHFAARFGHAEVALLLLEHGADAAAMDFLRTPLGTAVRSDTPLETAVRHHQSATARLLCAEVGGAESFRHSLDDHMGLVGGSTQAVRMVTNPWNGLEDHTGFATSMAFSPVRRTLASGGPDGTVRLWDVDRVALRHTLKGHTGSVRSVAFSPDGRTLASGDDDGTVRLWDVAAGALRHTLEGHTGSVRSVAFSPDGRTLASGSLDGTVRLWETAADTLRHTLAGHTDGVHGVAFSPDGHILASGGSDGTVRLWHPASGTLRHILEGHTDLVTSVAYSPDGQTLASGSSDHTVRLWNADTGTLEHTLKGHTDGVHSAAFSPDGQTLASAGSDGTVHLWETDTGSLRHILDDQTGWSTFFTFSPDGQTLASGGSSDGTVRLWDVDTGTLRHTLEGRTGWVLHLEFSPDGLTLASSGVTQRVAELWDVAGAPFGTCCCLPCFGLEARPSPLQLKCGVQPRRANPGYSVSDGGLYLWDTNAGSLRHTLEGHSLNITSLVFT